MRFIFFLSLLSIISIECIKSKKQPLRTYIVTRDNPIQFRALSAFTIYDSNGKKSLYRLKPTSTAIDTMIVVRQPENDMVGNVEGQWIENFYDVTFSLYDKLLNKWMDGTIKKIADGSRETYTVSWNGKSLNTKTSFWLRILEISIQQPKELLADIRRRSRLFNKVTYGLKIYSNQFPDIVYFFFLQSMIIDFKSPTNKFNYLLRYRSLKRIKYFLF